MRVRYMVNDVDAAVAFYTEQLGFHLDGRPAPPIAMLSSKEDLELLVSGPRTSAARPMPDGRKPEPGGWNRIVIQFDDLEPVVARLRAAGVTFRNEIISGPGGKQVLAEDPSGNPIELFEPA